MSKNTQSPEFFSGKSIPRNMLCPCNSGKKYKKCCFHNKLFEKPPLSVIQGMHIRGMEDDVLFRVGYKELPTEFVEKIDNWLEKNKIYHLGCWGNSHILALSKDIDGIDVVNGYYGYSLKDEMKENGKTEEEMTDYLKRCSQFLKQPDKDKGILRIPDGTGPENRRAWQDSYFDLNTRIHWFRHSWNKIVGAGSRKKGVGKDIHFDLTTEFLIEKESDSSGWTYLNEVETLASGSIKDVEVLKEKYDEELEGMTTDWEDDFQSGTNRFGNLNPNYQESSTPFPNPYPPDKDDE